MAKRLNIPRNVGEAERTLWHALDHLRTNALQFAYTDLDAAVILRRAICEVHGPKCTCK